MGAAWVGKKEEEEEDATSEKKLHRTEAFETDSNDFVWKTQPGPLSSRSDRGLQRTRQAGR